jgi:predicted nucleotidyltransferase
MNLSDPSMTISPSLDGPVLVVLANAGKPLTVSQVAGKSVRGSEIGIRKSLGRLVTQGIVTATEMGNSRVYNLNRDHVAAAIAIEMAGLRSELWQRTAREVEGWNVRPLYACICGSAARQDGDATSDIDLLLVRPPTLAEVNEAKKKKAVAVAFGMWVTAIMSRMLSDAQVKKWDANTDKLHGLVQRWTGNPLQIVSLSAIEWSEHRRTKSEIYQNISRDEVRLYDEFSPPTYKYSKGPNT